MRINNFIRYDSYSKADSPWVDETPSHWTCGRLKDFILATSSTKIPKTLNNDDLVEFVPMTNVNAELGIVQQFNYLPLSEVISGYTKFRNGDVIFAKITPCMENGNCAIVKGLKHNVGFGSTEFLVFRASKILFEKYLHYFLHNDLFRKNAEPFMKGTAGQKRIGIQYIETHFFCLPPLSEQQNIVDYLDAETARIDRTIDLLTQKAVQYAQLKQSLINETVTRGLEKSVKLKDSGIEWIGKVPEHWKIQRIKDVFTESKRKAGCNSSLYKVLSLTLKGVIVRDMENMKGKIPASFDGYQIAQPDNIVFCLFDMDVTPRIVGYVEEEGIITSAYTVVKKKIQASMKYYYYYFLEQNRNKSLLSNSKSLRSTLTFDAFSLLAIPKPPYEEQQAIADYLDAKTSQIDKIIDTINSQVDKLKELRKTLINDVVTGKIKVTGEDKSA